MAHEVAAIDLYWIPLGAGGHVVRRCGRVFERAVALHEHRDAADLFHAALTIDLDGVRHTIELAPSPDRDGAARGVVATGPVGMRAAGRLRIFRYELRCWRGGTIPDLGEALGGARRLSTDRDTARRIIDSVASVPTPVWGRDELRAGEMWNSNSVTAWLLARAGLHPERLRPPGGGRAPGWDAGCRVGASGPGA